jgi:undecaprenyl-diphosphatase
MHFAQIAILAMVQGAAELLPVSSSAHVIIAEKLMGLDPTSPEMTMLLVMLHTGTMFAVLIYFWQSWKVAYFGSIQLFKRNFIAITAATIATAIVGLGLQYVIKHVFMESNPGFEIEQLFGNTQLIGSALGAAGLLIIASSIRSGLAKQELTTPSSLLIGAVQGICLPFRGFSRSGATISAGLLIGIPRRKAEEFSFALAVALTPAVIGKEAQRLFAAQQHLAPHTNFGDILAPGILGMILSFIAGLAALRWLSVWLESGRWHLFGVYCLAASAFVLWVG